MRQGQGAASPTLLWLFVTASSLGVGGCLRGDLPSVVSRSSADAASQSPPPIQSFVGDGSQTLQVADASQPPLAETGLIALTIGLPIDTATGQVVRLGSLTVRLRSDGQTPRSLTLELNRPSGQINLTLYDIPAGGPYTLDVSATPSEGLSCAGSSPPFFVGALQTVRVLESLICGVDAGLTSTLYPGP